MAELFPMLTAAFLTVVSTILFAGFRIGFVFVDHVVQEKTRIPVPLCRILWALTALNSVLLLFGTAFELAYPARRFGGYGGFFWVLFAGSLLSLVLTAAFLLRGGYEEAESFLLTGLRQAPYIGLCYLILIFGLLLPFLPFAARLVVSCLAAAGAGYLLAVRCFAFGRLRFLYKPAVFVRENDYSIVFATSVRTVGCVEYTYKNEVYTLWDARFGRKTAATLHAVQVPKEHLENNQYTVRAVRAIEELPYGGVLGKKEIRCTVDRFSSDSGDELRLLTFTDWHGNALNWSRVRCECDALLLLGDVCNGVYSERSFARNLLAPCSETVHGRRPVLFVRGNHDLRGFDLAPLYDRLGLTDCTFRFTMGGVHFTMLDGGEDKPDDNFEFAGYQDNLSYTRDQLRWLTQQPAQTGLCVCLTHSPSVFSDPQLSREAKRLLAEKGVRLLLCGHNHCCRYIPGTRGEGTEVNTYIVGVGTGEQPSYSRITFAGRMAELENFDFKTGEELFSQQLILHVD